MALLIIILLLTGFVVWLNVSSKGKQLIQKQRDKIDEDKAKRQKEWQKIKDDSKQDFQSIRDEWNAQIAQDKENFKKTISSFIKK